MLSKKKFPLGRMEIEKKFGNYTKKFRVSKYDYQKRLQFRSHKSGRPEKKIIKSPLFVQMKKFFSKYLCLTFLQKKKNQTKRKKKDQLEYQILRRYYLLVEKTF